MNPNFSGAGQRQAFIFGAANTTGNVLGSSGFSQAFDLGLQGFAVVTLPNGSELLAGQVESKGFQITASSNVSGYFLSRQSATTDMTYLIDGERLGTDYFVAGYQNIRADQMSVQATADNTTVTFTPKGAAAFDVVLNAGQTYMYQANTNLTGSRVTSDKPIAVFSGNNCTNIPNGVSACDHIVEQIPSTDLLSSRYLVAQTPRTGTQGNVVRVVATANDTEVRVNGAVVATLQSGEFYEGRVVGGNQIDASKKVLVAQYLIGQGQAGVDTDPAMTIVPGADQWLKSYVFATPSGDADFTTDFVSIIIDTASLGSLVVNGAFANTSLFNPIGSTGFSFGDINVSDTIGPFSIFADTPFQLLLSGFESFDSYFTYGGAAFSPGASPPPDEPPPPPPPPPGTTYLIWDGDGVGNAGNGIGDGGDGTWTTTATNFTTDGGATNSKQTPQPGVVQFAGQPGVVTVDNTDGQVSVSGMIFTVGGYVIAGAPILLAGASAPINVGDGSDDAAAMVATIQASLFGESGITKVGAGTLVLSGVNTHTGDTYVNEGRLIGAVGSFGDGTIINNAALVIDQAAAATLGNVLDGTGSFTKRGAGTLTIVGENGLSGPTVVETGSLIVNGSLAASPVTINGAALLGGTGTVGAIDALAGSTIAPGEPIGTLNVTGTVNQRAGSTYAVQVTSTGQSDRILAGGDVTLASGAILNVTKTDAPRYVLNTRYTVLTSATAVSGRYTLTGNTRVSRFIDVIATYDPKNVYLNVAQTSRFASAAGTPNQLAAATGVDAAGNGGLFTAIAYLPDTASAQVAFDQVSGEIHATMRGATFEDSRFVREAVNAHLLDTQDAGAGLWIHGYGSWGSQDGDGNAAKYDRNIGGFFLGLDALGSDTWRVGVLAGYSSAKVTVPARSSRAETDDVHLGAYGNFQVGGFSGRFGIANMWRTIKTRRSVAFAGFSDTLGGDYKARQFQLFGDVGYQIDLGNVGIEPFAAAAYVDQKTDSFVETGGAAALRAPGDTGDHYWFTTLGARLKVGLPVGKAGDVGLTASAGWRHAGGGDRVTPVRLQFAAGPAFDVAGPPIADNVAALGFGVTARLGESANLDIGYSGQVGSGLEDHGLRAAFSLRF
ncbi:autotransporter domain-containing protein [Sandarakinorhabdus sp. DWP1-3-1]|uniref:autotransporter domain-containing protein n=1 Tax=Sandarakinorhabdus sp. DWP1-3-1 TaxID=2804627 RepID=UPI003CE93650